MTARRLIITAALIAWWIAGAIRDWWHGIDDAELGRIE